MLSAVNSGSDRAAAILAAAALSPRPRAPFVPDFTAYTAGEEKDSSSATRLLLIPAEAHLRMIQHAQPVVEC